MLTCLLGQVDNSGRLVFKPWEARLDKTDRVDSDADEELLINIPFTGDVKLKGIVVIGGEDETHPDKVLAPAPAPAPGSCSRSCCSSALLPPATVLRCDYSRTGRT